MKHVIRFSVIFCSVLFVCFITTAYAGDIIRIDDLTDNLSVNIINETSGGDQSGGGTLSNIRIDGELLTFDYTLPRSGPWAYSDQWVRLMEPGGGVSDIFYLNPINGTSLAHITFASDPATLTIPAGIQPLDMMETGDWQLVNETFGVVNPLDFQVRSDVPEPVTLLLLGLGLAGLVGLRKRMR